MMHVFLGAFCCLLMLITVLKIYFNRKGPKRVSGLLAKRHVVIVAVMMIVMIAHAFAAGIHGIETASGLICFALAVSTAASYYLMKKRNPGWKSTHRMLAILMLIAVIAHITIDLTIA